MIQQRLAALAQLAKVDGSFDDTEKKLITRIGKSNGLNEKEINEIIMNEQNRPDFQNMSNDEKFDLLYDAILVMKVDGQVLNEEIKYCEMLAETLGFELRAVMEMYGEIHPSVKIAGLKEKLRRKVSQWQEIKSPENH
jgi:tellurite resistance protein